jgi:hypothetical protein
MNALGDAHDFAELISMPRNHAAFFCNQYIHFWPLAWLLSIAPTLHVTSGHDPEITFKGTFRTLPFGSFHGANFQIS